MIPTYNCDGLFETTLRSVLGQDPGADRMQIAVVDDCSTSRHHEEILRRLALSRVELYRQTRNLGLAGNWNTCIARSRGRWVHILHQDDLVLPGFYERLERAGERPDVGASFCNHSLIDAEGRPQGRMQLQQSTAGVLPNWLDTISQHQHINCPSIVVRRDVYQHLGGFRGDLRYALDWEMWVRIAAHYSIWYEPEVLACYREHERNETSRLRRLNRDIPDLHRAVRIVSEVLPPELRRTAGRMLLDSFADLDLRLATEAFRNHELRPGIASFCRAVRFRPALLFSRTAFNYSRWALRIGLDKLLAPGRRNPPGGRPRPPEVHQATTTGRRTNGPRHQ
jgi:glycosyltransferase involved in cell wall biosynthesis